MKLSILLISATLACTFNPVQANLIFSSISQPGATSTNGLGVNNAGTAAGSSTYAAGSGLADSAWTWNASHTNFRIAVGGQDVRTNVNGISDDGTVVGFYDVGAVRTGFSRSVAGVVTNLGFVTGSTNTTPLDRNASGAIVGTTDVNATANSANAFLYQNGSFLVSNYSFAGANRTQFNSINNAGQIVGRWRDSAQLFHGLIYDSNTNVAISYDLPGALQTHFFGVNDLGQVVGYYTSASFVGTRGFLLNNALDAIQGNDTFSDIIYSGGGQSGSAGSRAYSINDRGTIVGTYNGFSQAYIATVPAPSTLAMLLLCGGFLGLRKNSSRKGSIKSLVK